MSTVKKLSIATAITTGLLLGTIPSPVRGDTSIRCESNNQRYNFCRVDTRGGVELQSQLSDDNCRMNRTWGYDRDGIWVDNGCRAIFRVRSRNSSSHHKKDNTAAIVGGVLAVGVIAAVLSDSSHRDKDDSRLVTCESNDREYQYCRVRVPKRASLHRQLSSEGCWEDSTWGYDKDGVWVDRGCRAEFLIK